MGSGGADIIFIIIAVMVAKRTGETLLTACGMMLIDLIGLILLQVIPVMRVKLVGFYMVWSYCAAYVLMIASVSNNISGYTKKIFYNGSLMIFYTVSPNRLSLLFHFLLIYDNVIGIRLATLLDQC